MKRLSRHTVVVLSIALLSCVGGLSLAVVAFGQETSTAPLSPYATTPTTPPAATTPPTTTPTTTTPTTTTPKSPTTTTGTNPERKHGTRKLPARPVAPPSRVTRNGPTHLAFTGGEPIYVGFAGVALMLGGLMLHRRRRAATRR